MLLLGGKKADIVHVCSQIAHGIYIIFGGRQTTEGIRLPEKVRNYLQSALYYFSATLSYGCLYLGFVQCNIIHLHFRDFPFEISVIFTCSPHFYVVGVGCERRPYAHGTRDI